MHQLMIFFDFFLQGDAKLNPDSLPVLNEQTHLDFICHRCGSCCSHIRGFLGEDEKKFFEEYAYGKLPLVQLIPIERTSFPLWDWEAKRFQEGAKELNIDSKIIPSRGVFDQKEQRTIIFTFSIDSDSCTFLHNGQCRIYDKRGFICKLFPFQKSPFLKTKESFSIHSLFGGCPSITHIIPHVPKESAQMVRFLHEHFGETFLNAVQHDIVTEWANEMMIMLMKKNVLKPIMNYPYDLLMKKISSSPFIDLTEFLVEKAIYSREQMDRIISDFDHGVQAHQRIKEAIEDDFHSSDEGIRSQE